MTSPSSMIIRNNHRVKQSNYTATNIPLNIPLTIVQQSNYSHCSLFPRLDLAVILTARRRWRWRFPLGRGRLGRRGGSAGFPGQRWRAKMFIDLYGIYRGFIWDLNGIYMGYNGDYPLVMTNSSLLKPWPSRNS